MAVSIKASTKGNRILFFSRQLLMNRGRQVKRFYGWLISYDFTRVTEAPNFSNFFSMAS